MDLEASQYKAYAFDDEKTVNKDHGRIEIRECCKISDPEVLRYLWGFTNKLAAGRNILQGGAGAAACRKS